MFKKVIDILLIFTLALQLFPTTQSGRLLIGEISEDECADYSTTGSNQLRQLDEEQHKDFHLEHALLPLPESVNKALVYHFSVDIPPHHHGSIPTPPPNFFS